MSTANIITCASAHPTGLASVALPSVFTLEITTACDNFCSGCANVELSRNKACRSTSNVYMARWREIIDQVGSMSSGQGIIRLSGGEPTLHPDFERIVQHLGQLGLSFTVQSTGRWGKVGVSKVIKILQAQPCFLGLLISLHGSNATDHCGFTESPAKAFVDTCYNIKATTQEGLRVFTNTVITNKNFDKISDIVSLSQQLGAEMAVFNRFVATEHALMPTPQQLSIALQTILGLRQQGNACRIGNSIPKCFFPHNAYAAPAGFELCHISPSGKVRPDNFSNFGFGNLFFNDLSNIWNSDKAHFFRNHIPNSCLDCAALPACRGGVKSLSVESGIAQGDPLMIAPLSFEQVQGWNDDKDKTDRVMLALTSD